jgi:hypothetical protein
MAYRSGRFAFRSLVPFRIPKSTIGNRQSLAGALLFVFLRRHADVLHS